MNSLSDWAECHEHAKTFPMGGQCPECVTETELVRRMTAAEEEAGETFLRVGGSTRHYVRDCLLPILKKHGLEVVQLQQRHVSGRVEQYVDGHWVPV